MSEKSARHIIHVDLDAFFAAVEVLDNPTLRGKPVIVGGSRRRRVVSSASYEARRFGVHSAMPVAAALRKCPHGVFLPVRMARYRDLSERVFEVYQLFTPLVEPLSIDEAFLDVTSSTRLFGDPVEIAKQIKAQVVGRTVTLKVKYADFRLITRSESLPAGTDDAREIFRTACGLLPKTAVGRKPVRLLGIALSQLNLTGEGLQLGLFEEQSGLGRTRQLNRALDRGYDRFGEKALAPAALYLKGREEEGD